MKYSFPNGKPETEVKNIKLTEIQIDLFTYTRSNKQRSTEK